MEKLTSIRRKTKTSSERRAYLNRHATAARQAAAQLRIAHRAEYDEYYREALEDFDDPA